MPHASALRFLEQRPRALHVDAPEFVGPEGVPDHDVDRTRQVDDGTHAVQRSAERGAIEQIPGDGRDTRRK